jgi:general stress protein 26
MNAHTHDAATLAKLMQDIDVAMFTTTGPNGYLVSRPLSTQAAQFDGTRVWFFTAGDSPKVAEIRRHPKVNLAYASKDRNTYLSVVGDARVVRDQALIDRYWSDALKAFFPSGKDDPQLVLIEVSVRTVEYWDGPGSALGQAISFLIAQVTGNDDVMAENRIVDVVTGRSRKPPASDRGGAKRAPAPSKRSASATRKRATAKRATAKRSTAKRTTAKRVSAKKPAAKKSAAKRTTRR